MSREFDPVKTAEDFDAIELTPDTIVERGEPVRSVDETPVVASVADASGAENAVAQGVQMPEGQGVDETPEGQSVDETPASEDVADNAEVPSASESTPVEGASEPWSPPVALEGTADNAVADTAGALASQDGAPPLPPASGTVATAADPDEPEPSGDEPDEIPPMSLTEHLGELRTRLVRALLGATVGFFLCYNFSEQLFMWLAQPLAAVMPADTRLIYTSVPEGFFVYLKVAFVAGVFVASPYIFYQIWAFIAPGLYREERRQVLPLALFSAFFFLLGASFCYFMVFPYAFTFFMSYSTGMIVAMPSIDEYLNFSLKMILAFGLIFEMPLFAFFLARMGVVTAAWMRKVRRYAVLVVFVVAAILTPPDVFSQLLMAVPMLVLYEISIYVAAAVGRKETAEPAKEQA